MSQQPQSRRDFKPCPECGGRRVEVQDNMHSSRFAERGPYAMFLTQNARSSGFLQRGKSNRSETITLACIQCGYIAWYALEPLNLVPDGK